MICGYISREKDVFPSATKDEVESGELIEESEGGVSYVPSETLQLIGTSGDRLKMLF